MTSCLCGAARESTILGQQWQLPAPQMPDGLLGYYSSALTPAFHNLVSLSLDSTPNE